MPLSQMRGDPAWDGAQVATPLESQEIFLVGQIARCDEKLTSKTCYNYSSPPSLSMSFSLLRLIGLPVTPFFRTSPLSSLASYRSPFLRSLFLFFTIFSFTITVQFAILFASLFVSHVSFFFLLATLASSRPFSFFFVPFYCHYLTLLFYFQTFFDLTWLALFLLVLTFLSYFEIFFFRNLLLYTDK